MDAFWQEVGLSAPDWPQLTRIGLRLASAALLAGVLGYDRERKQRPAGLRTHMLVASGSAMFTLVPFEAGASSESLTPHAGVGCRHRLSRRLGHSEAR